MKTGLAMLGLTTLLVILGAVLYVNDSVGWAQFLWVIASGTAGASVALIIEG